MDAAAAASAPAITTTNTASAAPVTTTTTTTAAAPATASRSLFPIIASANPFSTEDVITSDSSDLNQPSDEEDSIQSSTQVAASTADTLPTASAHRSEINLSDNRNGHRKRTNNSDDSADEDYSDNEDSVKPKRLKVKQGRNKPITSSTPPFSKEKHAREQYDSGRKESVKRARAVPEEVIVSATMED
jgi:hypothetical protein